MRKVLITCLVLILALFYIATLNVSAYSNESIIAKQAIENASTDIAQMQALGIPISRVNDTLQEAVQIYQAQLALENGGTAGEYSVVFKDTETVQNLTEIAIKANDELKVFNDAYARASTENNLSEMQQQYNEIQQSFKDQRFEDTLMLIDKGYASISNIQASQTTLNLFYQTTSNSLKIFFQDNWIEILIIAAVVVVALILFWTTFRKMRIRSQIKHLLLEKSALNSLIKKMQMEYFKTKTISETEYMVKTERFKEMIRDVERQLPLLREELVKLDKKDSGEKK